MAAEREAASLLLMPRAMRRTHGQRVRTPTITWIDVSAGVRSDDSDVTVAVVVEGRGRLDRCLARSLSCQNVTCESNTHIVLKGHSHT